MARRLNIIGGAGGVMLPLLIAILVAAAALPGRGAAQSLLPADRAALQALRDALDPGRRLPWDPAAATPCGGRWPGVACDGNRVVELRLPGKSLIGEIPLGTVGNLTALRKLSLRFNAISGEIPADVGNLAELRGLFLRGNRLAGGFPEGLFSLALLKKLDLAENRFTGGVSPEFNQLAQLDTLLLEGNDLGGELPADLNIRKLTPGRFNVSQNARLDGPVPASLAGMPASAFVGTGLCGGLLAACATPPPSTAPPPPSDGGGKKLSRWAIVGIIVGAVLVILLVMGLLAFLRRRSRRASRTPAAGAAAANVHAGTAPVTVTVAPTGTDAAVKQSLHPAAAPAPPAMVSEGKKLVFLGSAPDRPYDLETLLRASAEVLAKGVHGTTYRATLDGGDPVLCVKRLREVHIPEHEFRDRAAALGALRHENLPRLRAYFYSKEEKLLVYDFVGAGSLSSLLHGKFSSPPHVKQIKKKHGICLHGRSSMLRLLLFFFFFLADSGAEGRARLDFTARARIALAAARGVAFIHRSSSSTTHGNIKSSNIVVTASRDGAFVAGYGVPWLVGGAATPPPRRGAGYRAPEVAAAGTRAPAADVYSLGVVLLELLSGRAPAHALPDGADGVDLPRWVRSVVQEEWTSEVFDSVIANDARVEDEMMRLLQLGMECTEQRPDRRPAMDDVEKRIQRIVEDACRKADFSSTDGSRSVSA
ncbi:hypothetical protein EJB05_48982, partial [Eragrostis curvula]